MNDKKYHIRSGLIKRLKERYNFIHQISGRKGVNVYLGYDEIKGVKVIIKEITGNKRKRENDFSILRRLRHPGLPEVYDAFEISENLYIIIEYIEGMNLRRIVESKGIINEDEALGITLSLLEIIDYMNSIRPKPMIHGDIKPENVIYSKGNITLIDFGSVDTDEATSGFCAPERLSGFNKTIESDIYSIGELLHFMLSGEIKKIYSKSRNESISNDVYRIIDKSTRKLPSERFKNTADMAAQVQRIIKLRSAGFNNEKKLKVICIPGCAETACEMACAISEKQKNVLVADLDMLSPCVHSMMGLDKFRHCLQDYVQDDFKDLMGNCTKIKKGSLWILPCRLDYENYEHLGCDLIPSLISGASGFYDFLILSCSSFPYDRFYIDALVYCDAAFLPIKKGISDIRKYNAMIAFMESRQNIPGEKLFFMGIDNRDCNIGQLIAAGAVETSWLGSIPHNPLKNDFYATGNPYIFSLKGKYYSRYIRILKKAGVIN